MKIIIILLLTILLPVYSWAACSVSGSTLTAASASRTDVKACVDVSTYGDTINIPAGDGSASDWTSTLDITKDIKLKGAGIDITKITMNVATILIRFTPDATSRSNLDSLSDSHTFEITGVTFTGTDNGAIAIHIVNANLPVIKRVRIHNNKFINVSWSTQVGNPYGFAHILFDNNVLSGSGIGWSQGGEGQSAWTNDLMYLGMPGGGNGFYMEDNVIVGSGSYGILFGAGNDGYGQIFRYNTVTGVLGAGGNYWETHGNQWGGIYGPQITESYGNNITATVSGQGVAQRGGKAMVFYNVINNYYIGLWEEYSDYTSSAILTGGGIYSSCVEPGQGIGKQICNDTCVCQKVNDTYYHNNRASVSGTIRNAVIRMDYYCREAHLPECSSVQVSDPLAIVENYEFFNSNASCTGESCSSGVGCGTTLPTHCTTNQAGSGVGFWIPDSSVDPTAASCSNLTGYIGDIQTNPTRKNVSGVLYKCTSTDTWTSFYTPYTYPHPLRGEGTTPPSAQISTPTAAATYSTSVTPITLTGTATPVAPATISSVAWSNSAAGSGSCTGTTNWTCSNITLYSGTNILTVTAMDSAAQVGTDILTVTFDNTAPTLLVSPAPTIAANGMMLTLTFSEVVQNGAGGSGGWAISPSGGAATLTYASGSGTTSMVYTVNRRVYLYETVTLTYVQPMNGVEDVLGNDLAAIPTPRAVTNNSIIKQISGGISSGGPSGIGGMSQ